MVKTRREQVDSLRTVPSIHGGLYTYYRWSVRYLLVCAGFYIRGGCSYGSGVCGTSENLVEGSSEFPPNEGASSWAGSFQCVL